MDAVYKNVNSVLRAELSFYIVRSRSTLYVRANINISFLLLTTCGTLIGGEYGAGKERKHEQARTKPLGVCSQTASLFPFCPTTRTFTSVSDTPLDDPIPTFAGVSVCLLRNNQTCSVGWYT